MLVRASDCWVSWVVLVWVGGLGAQTLPPVVALAKARSLYYTPVDAGLESFHCEVSFDWKDLLQKANNQAVPDGDARLKYLQSIKLGVDDALRGAGELHWSAPAPPPDGTEDSVGKIREGMQQMWSGFFQSWNGFATGDLMTADPKAPVERTAEGYHVAVRSAGSLAEETFDNRLVLRTVHVATPRMESTLDPVFAAGARGLMVSTISSVYRQPPGAPPTEVRMEVRYAPVGDFLLPSDLRVTVGEASFAYRLVNCTVNTKLGSGQ